jgi:membrane protease YdiL (CAAX protease family)
MAVLPYVLTLTPSLLARLPVALPVFVIAQFLQACLVLFLLSWAGLRLGESVGLGAPISRALVFSSPLPSNVRRTLVQAAVAGILVGVALLALDRMLMPLLPPITLPAPGGIALWKRLLACFYGGITEELIARLFVMTLIVWVLSRIVLKKGASPSFAVIAVGIVGAALLFGLGHLPATAQVWPLTPLVIARTLLLNAVAALVFGFLYWRRGLEHAMCAHFCADIVVHVLSGG